MQGRPELNPDGLESSASGGGGGGDRERWRWCGGGGLPEINPVAADCREVVECVSTSA
jgi:hypothetical protein